ncbi:oligopeptidase A [Candidatus Blochmanniella floridana]|uniref:oligopeptidase A n=1 Tax=Blochmanniella floridana TaxID=203907 RepID=Q7VQU2_BLOFL|nr:oligopeptidase A [Candidatus Blochmannia floridanus]
MIKLNQDFLSNLPAFSSMKLSDVSGFIQKKINNCYSTVEKILSKKLVTISWKEIYDPIMFAENELKLAWSPIVHLYRVRNDESLRLVYENNLMSILEYRYWITHNTNLYKYYCLLSKQDSYKSLNITKKMALRRTLINYKLSGVYLSGDKKKYYRRIVSELTKLSLYYENNVLDATLGWKKLITNKDLLSGIPEDKLKIACLEAQLNNQKGWLFTLHYPSYSAILLYCDNSELREEFYWAFNTRASDQGPNANQWDNTEIMNEIISLRHNLAQTLGFNSYLEKSLQEKMNKNPQQILNFLMNLSNHIKYSISEEFLKIQNFAKKYYSCVNMQPWDYEYFREKQKMYLFSVSETELSVYFPEEKVLDVMFEIAKRLYGISIKKRNYVDVWHPSVQFFDIFDLNNKKWKGGFYLDLYLRDNKFGGAWMDVYSDMMHTEGMLYKQYPIVYLICNFSVIDKKFGQSCLLTFDNVSTLFHEFGHVLHHILTSISIPSISGVNGVSLDLVEVPSQFMEKFCWDTNILRAMSMHYKTKKSLSNKMINNVQKLQLYQSKYNLFKQVIYGLFDYHIHHEYDLNQKIPVFLVFNKIIKSIFSYPVMNTDRFPNTFTHIFSDDYAAGYYSYLWSDTLASKIWLSFKKMKLKNINLRKLIFDDMLYLSMSTNCEKYFSSFFNKTVTIQSLLKYYNISTLDNNFFKLL